MKKLIKVVLIVVLTFIFNESKAQSPIGRWKKISDVTEFQGQKYDSQKAILVSKPCVSKIYYEINADKTFRLNAKNSNCDEKYIVFQQQLYSKTNWKMVGNKITISTVKDFSVGQTYSVSFAGNKMIWVGTEGEGTTTYQKI